MAESAQQLAAALDRLTSAITSGSGLPRRLLQTQLQHLQIAFTALPVPCPAFRADGEQAVLRAAMAALQALADDRRARDRKWVLLVAAASEAWMRLWRSCHASTQKERVAWLLLHSTSFLATTAPKLLQRLTTAVISSISNAQGGGPVQQQAIRAMHGSAARCLEGLVQWQTEVAYGQPPQREMTQLSPAVAAAVELASLLINGSDGSQQQPNSCPTCCGLSPTLTRSPSSWEPALALSRAGSSMPVGHLEGMVVPTAPSITSVLHNLAFLHVPLLSAPRVVGEQLRLRWCFNLATAGGLPLLQQHFGLALARVRRVLATAGGSGSAPACAADLAALLGPLGSDAMEALVRSMEPLIPPATAFEVPVAAGSRLFAQLLAGSSPACQRCAPRLLRGAVEAVAWYPVVPRAHDSLWLRLLLAAVTPALLRYHEANVPWLPAFMRRAEPSLSAWVLAAAQQLRPAPAGQAAAFATSITVTSSSNSIGTAGLAQAVLQAASTLMALPDGLLRPPPRDALLLEQLLACAEMGMRLPCHATGSKHGLVVSCAARMVKAFVTHNPSSFKRLCRSGALPALVVTMGKCMSSGPVGLASWLPQLLVELVPAPGQAQPWFADSPRKQQLALLVLARLGGRAAEAVLPFSGMARVGNDRDAAQEQAMRSVADGMHAAAVHLGRQPLLRRLLEAAAPGMVPAADSVAASARGRQASADSSRPADQQPDAVLQLIQAEPLQLLVALRQQLDPLALGLRLRGCYNPACACLAGDSEADMRLKLCAGCKIARYCDAACAKAHWKHHKAGCKRVAAAAASAAAGDQQQR